MSDIFKPFSLSASHSPSLKKGLGSLFFFPPEKFFVYENSVKKRSVYHFPVAFLRSYYIKFCYKTQKESR